MTAILRCAGFQMGAVFVPPFEARTGDLICLHWPLPQEQGTHQRLIEVLTGQRPGGAVVIEGRIAVAETPEEGSWLSGMKTVDHVFRKRGVTEERARAILNSADVGPQQRLSELSLASRKSLGILIAWEVGNVVVFDAGGMDPLSRLKICDLTLARLTDGAAVQISYPMLPRRECCASARCLDLPAA